MISFETMICDHRECIERLAGMGEVIDAAARSLAGTVAAGGRIFVCGNGGSAADAQHFAAELIGRFEKERRPFPAIALTTDTSILTALSNDYGYDSVFSRQLDGLAGRGDVLVGISTSGNSENIINAMNVAGNLGLVRIVLCGRNGGRLKDCADHVIIVPSDSTARIQEAHIQILHYFSAVIEDMRADKVTP